LHKLTKNLMQR